jgi:hypothetical protein
MYLNSDLLDSEWELDGLAIMLRGEAIKNRVTEVTIAKL